MPESISKVEACKRENYWGEYSKYPVEDWIYAVMNRDTRKGYWEWADGLASCDEDEAEMLATERGD